MSLQIFAFVICSICYLVQNRFAIITRFLVTLIKIPVLLMISAFKKLYLVLRLNVWFLINYRYLCFDVH